MNGITIENIVYLLFRIFPILLIFYFVLSTLFSLDVKGFVYLGGLAISIILTIVIGKKWNIIQPTNPNSKCHLISLTNENIPYSNAPLSQTIYAYTFFFIVTIIAIYSSHSSSIEKTFANTRSQHLWRRNWMTILLFGTLFIIDAIWNIQNKCFSPFGTCLSIFIGSSVGVLWVYLFSRYTGVELQHFQRIREKIVCKRIDKSEFKCAEELPNSMIQE